MARTNQELSTAETCDRCRSHVSKDQEICSSCGTPTRYMSFKSRAEYEVEQWRAHKAQAPAAS